MIMVIDDEPAITQLLQDVLEDEGYTVHVAHNGQDGLIQITTVQPQLILSDVMMPVMDGIALCRHVQEHPQYRTIPLILMSAARQERIAECHYAAFVPKPFSLTAVLNTIQAFL